MAALTRSSTNKFIGGVCGGLSHQFGIDANLIRVVFVIAGVFGQIGWIAYLALWLLLPTDDGGPTGLESLKRQFDKG